MNQELGDDFVSDLSDDLEGDIEAHRASDPGLEVDLGEAVSTGITSLDLTLGGGLFPGRMYEVSGEESHGKSTLTYHMMSEFQRENGVVILLENESALDKDRAEVIGVDTSDLLVLSPTTFEKGATAISKTINRVRDKIPDRPVLVVWDTIASAPTQTEIDAIEEGADKWGGGQAEKPRQVRRWTRTVTPKISKTNVTIVLVNQVYSNVGGGYGSRQLKTPGGRGIRHHCSARMFLKRKSAINDEDKRPIGFEAHIQMWKTKQSPTDGKTIRVPLMFEDGFDSEAGIYFYLKDHDLVDVASNGYVKFQLRGEERSVQGQANTIQLIKEDPEVRRYFKYLMYRDFYDRYDQSKRRMYPVVEEMAEGLDLEPPEKPDIRVAARKFKRLYREDTGKFIDMEQALSAIRTVHDGEDHIDVRDHWQDLIEHV